LRKLFPVIFIFFLISLFSLKFLFLLPIVFIPLFFVRRKDFILFFIIFITIGIIRSGFFTFPSFENPKTDTLMGKVVSFEKRTSLEIKTEHGRVTVYKNRIYDLKPLDEVEVRGEFINDFGGNPGEESFVLYSISKNSILKFYARDIRVRKRNNSIISRIRNRINSNLNLLPEKYSFVRGIFMGGGSIEREIKEKFKYAGVMHLLAVSGLHLSILSMFLSFIFPPILVVVILFLYLSLILFPVSAVRAFIMISVYLIGKSFYRDVDTLNSLLFGAMIILFINPLSIISPSFLLTFLATFSIISIMSSIKSKLKQLLLVSPVSLFGVFPVIIYYFPIFSLIFFVSNIVISPIFTLFLPLSFVITLLSLIDKNFIFLIEFPADIFMKVIDFFSKTPISYIGIKKPHLLFIVSYLLLFLIVVLRKNWNIRINFEKVIFISLIVVIAFSFIYPYYVERNILKVVFFDVGEGDSIFIKLPSGKTVLIDGGGTLNDRKVSPGERVLDSLKRMGVNRLDMMIFTHEDADHIEGLFHVIDKELVKSIYGPHVSLGEIARRLIIIGKDKGARFFLLKRGDILNLDKDTKLYVLNPAEGGKDYGRAYDNNNSLFLVLRYKDFSLVLSGDVEKEGLNEICEVFPEFITNVSVYKVSHHGSKFSLSEEFFNLMSPRISVISVGPNSFGHPSQSIIDSLTEVGSKIYRTDLDGAIELRVYKEKMIIKRYNFLYILKSLRNLSEYSINFTESNF